VVALLGVTSLDDAGRRARGLARDRDLRRLFELPDLRRGPLRGFRRPVARGLAYYTARRLEAYDAEKKLRAVRAWPLRPPARDARRAAMPAVGFASATS
jgi:hypothetical protein